jgi:hypothetical protein
VNTKKPADAGFFVCLDRRDYFFIASLAASAAPLRGSSGNFLGLVGGGVGGRLGSVLDSVGSGLTSSGRSSWPERSGRQGQRPERQQVQRRQEQRQEQRPAWLLPSCHRR